MSSHRLPALHLDRAAWQHQPDAAWLSFLNSPDYAAGSRGHAVAYRPVGARVAPDSARVYAAMFGKYVRHLQARARNVLDADAHDLGVFLSAALAGSCPATQHRYRRLLERLHAFLHAHALRHTNPFTEWWSAQGRALAPSLPAPEDGRLAPPMDPTALDRLHHWMLAQARDAAAGGQWKPLRNFAIAAVCLGGGLRSREVLTLCRAQVNLSADPADALTPMSSAQLQIPQHATVKTARAHATRIPQPAAAVLGLWWHRRWGGPHHSGTPDIPGDWLFPATRSGQAMTPSTAYRALVAIVEAAQAQHVLTAPQARHLISGARGMRRQYALTELAQGTDVLLLQQSLGYHHADSVQRLRRSSSGMPL